jgi:hypothetical protein
MSLFGPLCYLFNSEALAGRSEANTDVGDGIAALADRIEMNKGGAMRRPPRPTSRKALHSPV